MTFQEAWESGCRFRRPPIGAWWYRAEDQLFTSAFNSEIRHIYLEDAIATDWELQEKSVSMTMTQLRDLWGQLGFRFEPLLSELFK